MNTTDHNTDERLDALLEGWREAEVNPYFTGSLLRSLPAQDRPDQAKIVSFPSMFGPGSVMGAAAAILLLVVIVLAQSSRTKMESDLVELDSVSDEAISDLYRLIHFEELAGMEDLAPEDADLALLLFATGG